MQINEEIKKIIEKSGRFKYLIGILLLLFGFFAMITPFTPGAILALVAGLQIFGIDLIQEKWKTWNWKFWDLKFWRRDKKS